MGKLKGIPHILSPDILHLLAVTGHGDEIVLADINFPTHSICTAGGPKEYRADGLQIPALLDAILTLMPLDNYVDSQVAVMNRTHRDVMLGVEVPILNEFRSICNQHFGATVKIEFLERFEFYERAKKTYAIIQTGETAPYGNILLKRGVC
ncbi:fucose mutarotase-like [Portunus trituberculatus]|uniref:fucose mutarotase-like n=1 Tax=Portunus trituberculatus TaxID=210409 RepID=UPI001E1CD7B4|nr:fucose mutarotase-like [Portunus trituberculatus]